MTRVPKLLFVPGRVAFLSYCGILADQASILHIYVGPNIKGFDPLLAAPAACCIVRGILPASDLTNEPCHPRL